MFGSVGGSPTPSAETQLVESTQRLHDQLKQREFHLAELIDEVVYAEDRKDEAVRGSAAVQQGVERLEYAFQQILKFQLVISEEVVLPALLDALDMRAKDYGVLSQQARRALHELTASSTLMSATKQLMNRVLATDAEARASSAPQGEGVATADTRTQHAENAVLLCGSLLKKEKDLLVCLETARHYLDETLAADETYAVNGSPSPARASSAEALLTINRDRRRSPSSQAATVDLQEQLSAAQRERDAMSAQLLAREKNEGVVSSLLTDKRQLENELLYAQRRTLDEQNRNRELHQRVLELESTVDRLQRANSQGLVTTEEELRRLSRGADIARNALEDEVARLRDENRSLVESSERLMQNAARGSGEAAAQRKVARLEGVVASLKADLHVMESRLAVIQDQREAERHRIVSQFDHEVRRLRRERDDCQQLISKMAQEVQLLSQDNNIMRGAASVDRL